MLRAPGDAYDYDAFGNLIASTGTTPNNYLFAGEQFDPALGTYFLRARYYNQNTGRFWSMDSDEGDPESPASLHKYLYVSDDPVDMYDPSGHGEESSIIGSLQVIAFQAILLAQNPLVQGAALGILALVGPAELVDALPPNFAAEVESVQEVEAGVREIGSIRRLLQSSFWLNKFAAGRKFEEFMLETILKDVPKERLQYVVKDGEAVANQARIEGSAVIDAIIKDAIYEFKTSFGGVAKYQAQQFAKFAKDRYPIEYVFLHKPTSAEVKQLTNWIKEIGPEIKLQVSYILD